MNVKLFEVVTDFGTSSQGEGKTEPIRFPVEEAQAARDGRDDDKSSMITRNSTDGSYVECMSRPAAHRRAFVARRDRKRAAATMTDQRQGQSKQPLLHPNKNDRKKALTSSLRPHRTEAA
ncbi:hypothetical protein MUK42_32959 [Musa troglodytarum]|uniref:Uncharacterized protein n=1 Tax=Musa troglodytarum TaxID=320322 RepID=A0A9E7FE94_9LILI|nr:hypothetical protein MUK42_32959 [Musa troglodytarum]